MLKPGMAIDAAEAKILKHRIETSVASPGVLALLAMGGLVLVMSLLGRADWMVVVSTLLLGSGVFLYSLARTVDKLVAIQKAIRESELRLLAGEGRELRAAMTTAAGHHWELLAPDGTPFLVRVAPADAAGELVHVSGARLYNLWVERRVKKGRGVPALREEMRAQAATARGRDRLLNGSAELPVLRLDRNDGFQIEAGREELMELIVSKTGSFPVMAKDAASAEVLRQHAAL